MQSRQRRPQPALRVADFVRQWIEQAGYLGVAFLMFLETIFPPIPSEVIMGLGGMAAARGDMAMVPLVLVGTAGTTLGNSFWYWVGRRVGVARFRPFIARHGRWLTLDWRDVEAIERFFARRGEWVIFAFRFLPTFRTMISLPAGMAAMPQWKFLVFTFAGSAIWNTVLAGAGLMLGSHFDELGRYVGPVAVATAVLIVVAYLYRVATWRPRE